MGRALHKEGSASAAGLPLAGRLDEIILPFSPQGNMVSVAFVVFCFVV